MNLKRKKKIWLLFLLIALIVTIGFVGGCTRGSVAIGWSGGAVADNNLFIGSNAGRLVKIDLNDSSILGADPLTAPSQGSFLSCASLGCGGGPTAVPIYGTPAVSNNSVYIAGYNGKIVAYRADLAKRWEYPQSGYLSSFVGSPVIYDNKLFIGGSDGKVYALDTADGSRIAEYQTGDRIWGTPAVDSATNTLFIGSYDQKFYALSTDDLSLKWSYETNGSIISTPAVSDGIVYFGSFDRNLYAVDISDGSLVWQFRAENWYWAKPILVSGVLYAGNLDGHVYAIDAITGNSVHEPYDLGSGVASSPVVVDNLVVFASREGRIVKIDSATMQMADVITLDAIIDGPLTADKGIVYIHPQTNVLLRVNPVTGAQLPDISL